MTTQEKIAKTDAQMHAATLRRNTLHAQAVNIANEILDLLDDADLLAFCDYSETANYAHLVNRLDAARAVFFNEIR